VVREVNLGVGHGCVVREVNLGGGHGCVVREVLWCARGCRIDPQQWQ
jgi:hypothetical protein